MTRWSTQDVRILGSAISRTTRKSGSGIYPRKPAHRKPTHSMLGLYFPNIEFQYEYRFAAPRRWRFDLALPEHKIAVEQEGGLWIRGRHNRAKGYIADLEKYNEATLLGWKVLRFTPQQVKSGIAYDTLKILLISNPAITPPPPR